MTVGGPEIVILLLVLVFLFGPALLAFWLGFTLGRKSSSEATSRAPQSEPEPIATEPSALDSEPASALDEEKIDD